MKIFLIGMMGAGKSSIGLILSKELGWSFFDTDELIGVDSYLDNYSMDEFRLEETNQINNIIKNNTNGIISIGGGAILSSQNRNIINEHSCIFLKASIDNLIDRIKMQNINRPLIKFLDNGDIDKKYFSQIYEERENYYLDLADFIVNTDRWTPLDAAMHIKEKIISYEIIN